jgi:hypothetical protein
MSQRARELAQALCSDAHLYGGHPCLCCQQAARQLVEGSSEEAVTEVESPSHGMSLKRVESRWALVLSSIRRNARLAAQGDELWGDTW